MNIYIDINASWNVKLPNQVGEVGRNTDLDEMNLWRNDRGNLKKNKRWKEQNVDWNFEDVAVINKPTTQTHY
jgi:hypothetical protein